MKTGTYCGIKKQLTKARNSIMYLVFSTLFLLFSIQIKAQAPTSPQVPFLQRTSIGSPAQTIYNVKGDFTMLGNTNLTLVDYGNTTDNQGRQMKYIDIDGDSNTWNSSLATLELSNSGENNATQDCSTVLFAGLYWTGKSDDADIFIASKQVQSGTETINNDLTIGHNQSIANTSYNLNITRDNPNPNNTNTSPIYTFTGNGSTYVFNYTNNLAPTTVTLSVGDTTINIPVTVVVSGTTATAMLTTPYIISDGTVNLTIKQLIRSTDITLKNDGQTQGSSFALVNVSGTIPTYTTITKNYDKKVISLKGPGAASYTAITAKPKGANAEILFPGAAHSGIFVGYQEITEYVKTHGPGAYTVADIALKEGSNSNPGFSGGWVMVIIYENPLMKSRAVTLFDGYAFVNGQLPIVSPYTVRGEYGTIPISGFTTVGSGPVNMKLGVMASEGDVALTGDYLAVQKLNLDPTVYPGNYLPLNHTGNSSTNFFNSSIFPSPTAGNSNPNLVNNTGVDFSMFTIPNANNSVIANNQTATTFRFGSSSDVFTIFGFVMSVDAYIPEPKGLISVTSINNVTNPPVLNALPGETINYSLSITNEGTEATNNTIITIPIPATAIFKTGTITSNLYHGATQVSAPIYNAVANTITWNLGTLPITAGHPEYVYANLNFTLNVTTDCDIILSAGCSPEVSLETGTITGTGAISGSPFTKYFFQGYDDTSCHLPIDGSIKVAIDASSCASSIAGLDQTASCDGELATLAASAATTGTWSIVSGPIDGREIFSAITSPNSTFYSPNLGVYTLRWTTSCGATDDVEVTFTDCAFINFDGVNDNINLGNNYNLNTGSFSIETWVKSNALTQQNGTAQTIISKRTGPNSTDGYDLRLVNNYISFNWNNGKSITSSYPINQNRWHHVAVTFNGSEYNLYIDGILVKASVSGNNPVLNNSVNCVVGSMDQEQSPELQNCYNGWLDELRIWNVALTANQIRQMMNQEIKNDGGNVKGAIVPLNVVGLTWNQLAGYYQMNSATDIVNGFVLDKATAIVNGELRNINTQQDETAPLPYTTKNNGEWSDKTSSTPWTYGDSVWDFPNSIGYNNTNIDWNIVQTSHNITSGDKDITVLGLISTAGKLTIAEPTEILNENNSGQSLRVTHYLELDGDIDLVGESQLLQDEGSILDQDSGGFIERDQQGTANSFNYNYWASPVGSITLSGIGQRGTGIASANVSHKLVDVLKDGTGADGSGGALPYPKTINFQPAHWAADSGITTPIIISSYWLYTFNGTNNTYSQWNKINQNTVLMAGEGYTMKGTSGKVSILDQQNYVFKGKPNNGDIKLFVAFGKDRLVGNPYPSAMDADEFIKDNIKETINSKVGRNANNVFNGALYFWDHFGQINTHILREYVGGYATYNLIGGAKAISNDYRINANLAEGSKIPTQFIPVGQGFFVVTSLSSLTGTTTAVDGGDIVFKNSQRIFKTEASGNSVFMKGVNAKNPKGQNENNASTDKRAKIWLQFNSPTGYHRQLLVGVDENASNHFDLGYDAPIADIGKEDMFWAIDGGKFVIQGVDNFDKKQELSLGLKIFKAGLASIKIDATANLDKNIQVYLKDKLTGKAHKLDKNPFEIQLEPGNYLNRFYLAFNPGNTKEGKPVAGENENDQQTATDAFLVYMNNKTSELQITKPLDAEIVTVNLYNYLGQSINSWNTNLNENSIYLPIKVSSGAYIVQVNTKNGTFAQKVIVE